MVQHRAAVAFAVSDLTGQPLGTITPADPGSVTCTAGRRVWRNLDLDPADWENLDPYDTLIAPTVTFDGVSWQVGVFAIVSDVATWAAGTQQGAGVQVHYAGSADLADQTVFLDRQLAEPVGLAVGQPPSPLIESLLEDHGFSTHDVAWLPAPVSEPSTFDGSALSAVDAMCEGAGAYPLYFTGAGVPTVELIPAPEDMTADHVYGPGDGLVQGPPRFPAERFSPNRWEALGGTDEAPQVGTYDLPSGLPGSYPSRGFQIIDRFAARGVTDQTTLDLVARGEAVTAFREAQGLAFDALPEEHGAWDVIAWTDENGQTVLYLEESWTLPLRVADMAHACGRVLVEPPS